MIPAPEHSHGPHAHGSGIRWLDAIVAISAIFISVVSLVVSIEHGRTMEKMVDQNQKMVEADTLPLLELSISETVPPDHAKVELALKNSGVGPAIVDKFQINYKGRNYASLPQLLDSCCSGEEQKEKVTLMATYSSVSSSVLPARDSTNVFQVNAEKHPEILALLEKARPDITVSACYCSVLDQCWETKFDHQRPKPVAECKIAAEEVLW